MDFRHEIFSKVLRQQVGRAAFICANRATELQQFCHNCQTHEQEMLSNLANQTESKIDVVYGFFEANAELQAFAIEPEDQQFSFIAVSSFVPVILSRYFYAALAHRDVLAELSGSDGELSNEEYDLHPRFSLVPISAERKRLAGLLTALAVRFLTAHELVHIINGHVLQQRKVKGISQMAESIRMASNDEALFRQTLEMDADCGAVRFCLQVIIGSGRDATNLLHRSLRPDLQTPERSLRLWLFAVYSLFRIMADGSVGTGNRKFATHPAPMLRLGMIVGTVDALLKKDGTDPQGIITANAFDKAIGDGEQTFAMLSRRNLDTRQLSSIASPESKGHMAKIISNWRNVRPLLEPFNRGGRLAPLPLD